MRTIKKIKTLPGLLRMKEVRRAIREAAEILWETGHEAGFVVLYDIEKGGYEIGPVREGACGEVDPYGKKRWEEKLALRMDFHFHPDNDTFLPSFADIDSWHTLIERNRELYKVDLPVGMVVGLSPFYSDKVLLFGFDFDPRGCTSKRITLEFLRFLERFEEVLARYPYGVPLREAEEVVHALEGSRITSCVESFML